MTKPVTFFFERKRSEAATYEFEVEYPQGKFHVFVYANGSVKRSLLVDQPLKKSGGHQLRHPRPQAGAHL